MRAKGRAIREQVLCYDQIAASYAICDAIPNRNNVWYQIFDEHKRINVSRYNFWRFKEDEAWAVFSKMFDKVDMAHRTGTGVTVFIDFII